MSNRPLTPRHLAYAKYRSQGMTPPKAFAEAGYTSEKTNAYRLEGRPDIQSAIEDFRKRREELFGPGESTQLKAEDLSDPTVTSAFLLQTLIDALSQARAMGDPKTVLAITVKLADLLAVKFDASTIKDDIRSTASILKELEAIR